MHLDRNFHQVFLLNLPVLSKNAIMWNYARVITTFMSVNLRECLGVVNLKLSLNSLGCIVHELSINISFIKRNILPSYVNA